MKQLIIYQKGYITECIFTNLIYIYIYIYILLLLLLLLLYTGLSRRLVQ